MPLTVLRGNIQLVGLIISKRKSPLLTKNMNNQQPREEGEILFWNNFKDARSCSTNLDITMVLVAKMHYRRRRIITLIKHRVWKASKILQIIQRDNLIQIIIIIIKIDLINDLKHIYKTIDVNKAIIKITNFINFDKYQYTKPLKQTILMNEEDQKEQHIFVKTLEGEKRKVPLKLKKFCLLIQQVLEEGSP